MLVAHGVVAILLLVAAGMALLPGAAGVRSGSRALAAYEVTRDIKLEAGLQFVGLFTGVGRGPYIYENSEAVTMIGTTFGFTINR